MVRLVFKKAAAALTQMAARGAKGDAALGGLIRERQDLIVERYARDKALVNISALPPNQYHVAAKQNLRDRLLAIDAALASIDRTLGTEFPDFAAIMSAEPLTVEQVQADLRPDEAQVLFLDTSKWEPTPEETFVWVVTKTDVRWVRSELGTPALMREVAALRCGLDLTAWNGDSAKRCGELLKIEAEKAPKQASLLSQGVGLRPAEKPASLRPTAWLARDHALTVLPAVSSLKALRRTGKPSFATRPMISFGNPLLEGDQGHPQFGTHYKQQAALARANQNCPVTGDMPWGSVTHRPTGRQRAPISFAHDQ